jgi:hypothetical protein
MEESHGFRSVNIGSGQEASRFRHEGDDPRGAAEPAILEWKYATVEGSRLRLELAGKVVHLRPENSDIVFLHSSAKGAEKDGAP